MHRPKSTTSTVVLPCPEIMMAASAAAAAVSGDQTICADPHYALDQVSDNCDSLCFSAAVGFSLKTSSCRIRKHSPKLFTTVA